MFLRKTKRGAPAAVTISGVRMGERLLQIGVDDQALAATLSAKVGLSGNAALAVADEAGAAVARRTADEAGILVDIRVSPFASLPFANDAFDIVFVHNTSGFVASLDASTRTSTLRECHRVLRPRGRIIAAEPGSHRGLGAWLRPTRVDPAYESAGGTIAAFESAGFRPVRVVGELEGFKFIEGLKT